MSTRRITAVANEWPRRLDEANLSRPPKQLFLEGKKLETDGRGVAVVGARRPTATGLQVAREIACGLAQAGLPVVSGLAVGIDAAAHQAALDAGGYTVAVLGCGLDVDYPKRNARLKERIRSSGTLVTEYELGTPPEPANFPMRNRIIAALCEAVVFVEGSERSGGIITARHALECDRTVFAVPGSVRNALAEGPNELIRTSQAALVTSVRHVLEDIAPALVWGDEPCLRRFGHPLVNPVEGRLLSFLDDAPTTVDRMCQELTLTFGEVAMGLAALEVRNFVAKRAGGYAITEAGARARRRLLQNEGADSPIARDG